MTRRNLCRLGVSAVLAAIFGSTLATTSNGVATTTWGLARAATAAQLAERAAPC